MRHFALISHADARRGVILMVVLVLLTLFAILGLSFVLYANAQHKSSDLALQAEEGAVDQVDISPDALMTSLLTAMLFPQDDSAGIYSAYRGYDLARSMYGYDYIAVLNPVTNSYNIQPRGGNNAPYSGVGRIHEDIMFGATKIDGFSMVN